VAAADAAGSVDALVCCAGAPHDRAFTAQDDASWSGVLAGVVDGTRVMARAVARRMQRAAEAELAAGPTARPSARRIVALAPATTRTATAGGSASAAAGGAVLALTATLARELGPWGIRVNAVLVGFVETRLTARLPDGAALGDPSTPGLPEPVRQMAAATTALGRMGTPEEVAGAVAFLLGPDADYVTGAVLPVTGGLLGT
jgi:NAD(P)-dependent dehydrogenase (short-subunit alcohol dehydrogenase family)